MNCGRRIFLTSWAMCLLFVAAASAARAGSDDARPQHPIDRALDACIEHSSTAEFLACEDKARMSWDRELDRVYRALHAKLTPREQRALEKSQRAWIQFRDSELDLMAEYYGQFQGTMWLQVHLSDRTELSRTRALALQRMLDRLENRVPLGD